MSSFLDSLERELIAAVERQALTVGSSAVGSSAVGSSAAGRAAAGRAAAGRAVSGSAAAGSAATKRRARAGRASRLPVRLLLAAALVTLAIATAALAATGVLFTGSAVAPIPQSGPRVGIGIPSAGGSRLIARSVPDPAGGAPWDMRIIHTTRGQVCLQVGRLHHGRIGVIGQDGAFHDDGLFHPLSKEVIAKMPQRFATACDPEGINMEGEIPAMPASAENGRGTASLPASKQRRLYFGLLGPKAVSLVYERGSGKREIHVEPGTGAFLIVLPGNGKGRDVSYGGGNGFPSHDEGRIRAVTPIVEITYKVDGHLCEEGYIKPVGPNPCPRESPEEAVSRAHEAESPRDLDLPIHVSLSRGARGPRDRMPGHSRGSPREKAQYTADISFRAPFGVRNAQSSYGIELAKPNGGGVATFREIERDVRRDAIVHITSTNVFANSHGRPVTIQIVYQDLAAKGHRSVIVGQTTVKEP